MWLMDVFLVTFLEGEGDIVHTYYSHVEGRFTCGSYSCVEGHSRVGVIHMCGTSHQSEILHSLIFLFID